MSSQEITSKYIGNRKPLKVSKEENGEWIYHVGTSLWLQCEQYLEEVKAEKKGPCQNCTVAAIQLEGDNGLDEEAAGRMEMGGKIPERVEKQK